MVLTDGEPNGGAKGQTEVGNIIKEAADKVDSADEIGVTFIQVGKDEGATKFLKWLDDDLVATAGVKHDIVDTVKAIDTEGKPLIDVFINALTG